jgi:hypothetical protein
MTSLLFPKRINHNSLVWEWVSYRDIDRLKYDRCVNRIASWPFMYSWYWDAVCSSWGAYVNGDYEMVFPVYVDWKWGFIPVLSTPYCVKWIDGDSSIAEYLIKRYFGLKNLAFSFYVKNAAEAQVQILECDFNGLASGDLKRNLKKAERQGYSFQEKGKWENFAVMMRKFHPYPWHSNDERVMFQLYTKAAALGYGCVSEVLKENEVVASYFYIVQNAQLLLVQNVTKPNHKAGSPMALLIFSIIEFQRRKNHLIQVHFMGSSNPGVAEYNKKFSAKDVPYYRVRNF